MPKAIIVPKDVFFTWILNIARNAAIDELRSKSHKNQKLNLSADYFVGIEETKNEDENEFNTERIQGFIKNLKKILY